ncbi:serine/threonine-protein kinase [Sorangium sp. So ce260]|uniref:serine/threonine-protein kinase n=1 Tax=Sorangium sp. So ce260 TaxID=3133291 RepID=UPI003F63FDED
MLGSQGSWMSRDGGARARSPSSSGDGGARAALRAAAPRGLVYHRPGMWSEPSQPGRIGRYLLYSPIASGGMASVHLGRLVGEAGFARTVAVKRLHPQLAEAPEIAESLRDEARIVARIQHPNVVATIDLLIADDEAFLVMDYVRGESLARLLRAARARGAPAPIPIVASIACGALHGLHAAHEARSESGEPLGIVHRDVSPENVLVGVDGTARLLDFGIAKARGRLSTTRGGQLKGKLAYMSPEQILCADVTRRTDVFAAGVVLWEALAGQRLFDGGDEAALVGAVLERPIPPPSSLAAHVPPALDAVVLRALERNAEGRYPTARELAIAIEEAVPLASPRAVGEWVEDLAGDALARRAARVAEIESASAAALEGAAAAGPGSSAAALEGAAAAGPGSSAAALEGAAAATSAGWPDLPGGRDPRSAGPPARGLAETAPDVPTSALAQAALAAAPPPGSATSSGLSVALSPGDGALRGVPPPATSRRARPVLALLGVALLGSAAALAAQWARRSPPGPEDAASAVHAPAARPAGTGAPDVTGAPTAPAPPAPSPPGAVSATPVAPAPPPASSPGSAPSPPPASSAAVTAPARRPARPAGGARAPAPTPRAAGADAQRCSPPYTVDKAGIRRLKPECM